MSGEDAHTRRALRIALEDIPEATAAAARQHPVPGVVEAERVDAVIRSLQRQGYVIAPAIIDADRLARAVAEINGLAAPARPPELLPWARAVVDAYVHGPR